MVARTMTAAILLALSAAGVGHADPRLSVQVNEDSDRTACRFWGDGETLSIADNGHPILEKSYCAAYGESTATIVTDKLGHHYVFLKYGEGHGSDATIDYLTIYLLSDHLTERKTLILSERCGLSCDWTYNYAVHTSPTGGLQIILTLVVDGRPDAGISLPRQTRTAFVDPSTN